MTTELAKIDLAINIRKCELYLPTNSPSPPGFGHIPVLRNRDAWLYLGTPLSEQTTSPLDSVLARIKQATTKITAFAKSHPKQAFLLLRATAGACKVEYLLQTLTQTTLTDHLVATCSAEMRLAYAAITRSAEMDAFTWTLVTLPQSDGGFGLRDPKTIVNTARLASLVNVTERAIGFGATKKFIDIELEKAVSNYVAALGTGIRPNLEPSRDLQKILTQPLHAVAIDWLVRNADEPTRQLLNSLTTPHATAWLSSTTLLNILT